MPWCPNCKNEYKEGYTVCADCGAQLVDHLKEEQSEEPVPDVYIDPALIQQAKEEAEREKAVQYEDSSQKAENYRSGAGCLLVIGCIGAVLLILIDCNVLPLHFSTLSKVLINIVMGVLFAVFIFQGIASFRSSKKLDQKGKEEEKNKNRLKQFFKESVHLPEFDEEFANEDLTDEILYFKRTDKMKKMAESYDAELDSSFIDYVIEDVYAEIFEN